VDCTQGTLIRILLEAKMTFYIAYASVGRLEHCHVTIIKNELLNIEYCRIKLLEEAEEVTLYENGTRTE
jgi:hypothetical protein